MDDDNDGPKAHALALVQDYVELGRWITMVLRDSNRATNFEQYGNVFFHATMVKDWVDEAKVNDSWLQRNVDRYSEL